MCGTLLWLILDAPALKFYGLSLSFQMLCVVVVVYVCGGGTLLREILERWERFRNDLDRVVDIVGNKYRLCVIGDLNKWVGDKVRVDITGYIC